MLNMALILVGSLALFIFINWVTDGTIFPTSRKCLAPKHKRDNEFRDIPIDYELPDIEKDPLAIQIKEAAHKHFLKQLPPIPADQIPEGTPCTVNPKRVGGYTKSSYIELSDQILKLYKGE